MIGHLGLGATSCPVLDGRLSPHRSLPQREDSLQQLATSILALRCVHVYVCMEGTCVHMQCGIARTYRREAGASRHTVAIFCSFGTGVKHAFKPEEQEKLPEFSIDRSVHMWVWWITQSHYPAGQSLQGRRTVRRSMDRSIRGSCIESLVRYIIP